MKKVKLIAVFNSGKYDLYTYRGELFKVPEKLDLVKKGFLLYEDAEKWSDEKNYSLIGKIKLK